MNLGIETGPQFEHDKILYQCGSCGNIIDCGTVELPKHNIVGQIICFGEIGRRITYREIVERRQQAKIVNPV